MASKIILTADDFGCMDFINNGIYKALEKGAINSVACFVVFPESRKMINELIAFKQQHDLDFGIGLHFSITAGSPVNFVGHNTSLTSSRKDAAGNYQFTDPENFKPMFVSATDMVNELKTQIDFLHEILTPHGEPIDSVSNHHGVVYMKDKLFKPFADECAARKIPIRSPISWMRSTLSKDEIVNFAIIADGLKLRFFKELFSTGKKDFEGRRDYARSKGIKMPYCLNDMIYGNPTEHNMETLLSNYTHFIMSSEFMFHLGDETGTGKTREQWEAMVPNGINPAYFKKRTEELAVLMDPALQLNGWLSSGNVLKSKFRNLDQWDWEEPKPLH